MNARTSAWELSLAHEAGIDAAVAKQGWRSCALGPTPLRAEWLKAWIKTLFGGASTRAIAKSGELKTSYLAAFHVEQRTHYDAADWELVSRSRAP